ncbi:hypothetical protein V2J09_004879 [Rumex salicifolius]
MYECNYLIQETTRIPVHFQCSSKIICVNIQNQTIQKFLLRFELDVHSNPARNKGINTSIVNLVSIQFFSSPIAHSHSPVIFKLRDVVCDPDAGEHVRRVSQKTPEGGREVVNVDEFDYKAAVSDAQLECGGGIVFAAEPIRPPLDVESDDDDVPAPIDVVDASDPVGDGVAVRRHGYANGSIAEIYGGIRILHC